MATIELTKDNVQQTIDENEILLVDFWGEGCGPCMMFKPIFEKASEANPDMAFATCNTTAEQEVAMAFGIQSVPTLAVFRDKMLLFMQPGALPAPVLDELIGKVRELDMDAVRAEAAEHEKQHPHAHDHDHEHDHEHEHEPDLSEPAGAPPPEAPPAPVEATVSSPSDDPDGLGIAVLAGDPVLRRQGVTREFLESVHAQSLPADQLELSRDVLTMYDALREGLREAEDDDERERVRGKLASWTFNSKALDPLPPEVKSELKAVLRAIDDLVRG